MSGNQDWDRKSQVQPGAREWYCECATTPVSSQGLFLAQSSPQDRDPVTKVLFIEIHSTGVHGRTAWHTANRPACPRESVWSIFPKDQKPWPPPSRSVNTAVLREAVAWSGLRSLLWCPLQSDDTDHGHSTWRVSAQSGLSPPGLGWLWTVEGPDRVPPSLTRRRVMAIFTNLRYGRSANRTEKLASRPQCVWTFEMW